MELYITKSIQFYVMAKGRGVTCYDWDITHLHLPTIYTKASIISASLLTEITKVADHYIGFMYTIWTRLDYIRWTMDCCSSYHSYLCIVKSYLTSNFKKANEAIMIYPCKLLHHEDVIKWKLFQRYWPFVRGIHWSPVNSPHKDQWRGALMFSLICARINA